MNSADITLGSKIIAWSLNILAFGASLAAAWACSSVVLAIITFIVMSILTYVLSLAAMLLLPHGAYAAVGSAAHSLGDRVSGVFARFAAKGEVAAA